MKICTRILSLLIAFVLAIAPLTLPSSAQAGVITNLILQNYSAIALEFVERGVLYGLGTAAGATSNEQFSQVLSISKRILGGPTGTILGGISQMCQGMIQQLDAISTSLSQNFASMDQQLGEIKSNQLKLGFYANANPARKFYEKYNTIYNIYYELITALQQYSADPTQSNNAALQTKYNEVNNFYSKGELYALITEMLGIPDENIRDGYGSTEHSVPYFECKRHHFHLPVYSRMLIRDVETLRPLPLGEKGFANFITPHLLSVPAVSVLMGDLAVLHPAEECGCGLTTPYMEILGRAGTSAAKSCAVTASELLKR
ncbi:MAG: hypothetical protein PHI98_00510 [Eubacteriales bacterium]|nr:hypothetical protein [Eubacteriales bacterium]